MKVGEWNRFDYEAISTGGRTGTRAFDDQPVDHAASAASNLRELLRDLAGVLPDKTYTRVKFALLDANGVSDAVLTGLRETVLGAIDDVMDAPIYALGAVKDLGDAAVHGVIAGWQKIAH